MRMNTKKSLSVLLVLILLSGLLAQAVPAIVPGTVKAAEKAETPAEEKADDPEDRDYWIVTFDPNGGSFPMTGGDDTGILTVHVPKSSSTLRRPYNAQNNTVFNYDNTPPNPSRQGYPADTTGIGAWWYWHGWSTREAYEANNTQNPSSYGNYPPNFFQRGTSSNQTEDKVINSDLDLIGVWGVSHEAAMIVMGFGNVEFYDGDRLYRDYSYPLSETCRAIILPDPEPTKEGYSFVGWNVREGSSELTVKDVKTYAAGERFTHFGLIVPTGRDKVYQFEAVWELYADSITVKKVDQYGQPVPGVAFEMEYSYTTSLDSGNGIGSGGKIGFAYKEYTTDANGEFVIDPSEITPPARTYLLGFTLTEEVPSGYEAPEDGTEFGGSFKLTGETYQVTMPGAELNEDGTVILSIQNYKIEHGSTVTVRKIDQYGNPIAGVRFEAWTVLNESGPNGYGLIQTYYTTDEKGEFVLDAAGILSQQAGYNFQGGTGPWTFPGFLLTEYNHEGYLWNAPQFRCQFVERADGQYDILIREARDDGSGNMVLTVENTAIDLTLVKKVYGLDAADIPAKTAFNAEPQEGTYEGDTPPTLSATYDQFTDGSYVFPGPIPYATYLVKEDEGTAFVEGYTLFIDYAQNEQTIQPVEPPEVIKKVPGSRTEAPQAEIRPGSEIVPLPDPILENFGIEVPLFELNRGTVTVSNYYLRDIGLVKLVKETEGLPEGTALPEDTAFSFLDENGEPVEFLILHTAKAPSLRAAKSQETPVTQAALSQFSEDADGRPVLLVAIPTGTYTLQETGADVDGYKWQMSCSPDPIEVEKVFDFLPMDYFTLDELEAFRNGDMTDAEMSDVLKNEIFRPLLLFPPEDGVFFEEDLPEPQTVKATNSYFPSGSLTVTKTFEGLTDEQIGKLAESLTFTVTHVDSGTELFTLSYADMEDGTFGPIQVPVGKYTVTESIGDLPGYTLTVSGDNSVEKEVAQGASVTFAVTNTYAPQTVRISVIKVWEDHDNESDKRPESVTVVLYANGKEFESAVLSEQSGFSALFEGPLYLDGQPVTYTVDEPDVPEGYIKSVSGNAETAFTITNTFTEQDVPPTGESRTHLVWTGALITSLICLAGVTVLLRRKKAADR